jgi:hypothetical protein
MMDTPATVEELEARVAQAYAAYADGMGGVDAGHLPLPPYGDLHDLHKGAWRQAVRAALGDVPPPVPEPVPAPETEPVPVTEPEETPPETPPEEDASPPHGRRRS